jgi:hypothetical protein
VVWTKGAGPSAPYWMAIFLESKLVIYLFIYYYYRLKQTSLDKLVFSLDFLKKEKKRKVGVGFSIDVPK